MINKESILLQIKEVEDNIRRLKTLVEVDLAFPPDVPDSGVPLYCLEKSRLQIENMKREIGEHLGRVMIIDDPKNPINEKKIGDVGSLVPGSVNSDWPKPNTLKDNEMNRG